MTGSTHDAFDSFLVEDVILTLGTVRGALGWLEGGEDCPPAQRAEAFARITRQIAALEDRARGLWGRMRSSAVADADCANVFRLSDGDGKPGIAFRSRRLLG